MTMWLLFTFKPHDVHGRAYEFVPVPGEVARMRGITEMVLAKSERVQNMNRLSLTCFLPFVSFVNLLCTINSQEYGSFLIAFFFSKY